MNTFIHNFTRNARQILMPSPWKWVVKLHTRTHIQSTIFTHAHRHRHSYTQIHTHKHTYSCKHTNTFQCTYRHVIPTSFNFDFHQSYSFPLNFVYSISTTLIFGLFNAVWQSGFRGTGPNRKGPGGSREAWEGALVLAQILFLFGVDFPVLVFSRVDFAVNSFFNPNSCLIRWLEIGQGPVGSVVRDTPRTISIWRKESLKDCFPNFRESSIPFSTQILCGFVGWRLIRVP